MAENVFPVMEQNSHLLEENSIFTLPPAASIQLPALQIYMKS